MLAKGRGRWTVSQKRITIRQVKPKVQPIFLSTVLFLRKSNWSFSLGSGYVNTNDTLYKRKVNTVADWSFWIGRFIIN